MPKKSVLLKGLKFTPTPEKRNCNQTENDVNDFCRKLRLKNILMVTIIPIPLSLEINLSSNRKRAETKNLILIFPLQKKCAIPFKTKTNTLSIT